MRASSPANPSSTRCYLTWAAWIAAAAGAFSICFSLTARWFWPAEILCHFRPHGGALLLVCAVMVLGLRLWRPGIALLVLALVAAWPTLALCVPRFDEPARSAPLRVASSNLLWGSRAFEQLATWLEAERPDVVFLCEVDLERRARVEDLRSQGYPYQLIWPAPEEWRRDTWGRALISRRPLDRATTHGSGPILDGWIEHEGRRVRVLGAHPMRPGRTASTRLRNEVLEQLVRLASEQAATVVLGDLNLTESTPRFDQLLDHGALSDTRAGRGPMGTWRVKVPRFGWQIPWLRLPIDHILVGADLTTLDRRTGPEIGSDHYPVIADVGWR